MAEQPGLHWRGWGCCILGISRRSRSPPTFCRPPASRTESLDVGEGASVPSVTSPHLSAETSIVRSAERRPDSSGARFPTPLECQDSCRLRSARFRGARHFALSANERLKPSRLTTWRHQSVSQREDQPFIFQAIGRSEPWNSLAPHAQWQDESRAADLAL